MLVVVPVWRISKGPGKRKVKWIVLGNLSSSFVIGLLPWLGDYINTKRKYNVKSASMLEAMLLKRADEARSLGPDAEKVVGRMNGHQRAGTNGHLHTAAANTHHDSEPPTYQPQRYGHQRAGTNGHLHTAATNTHHDSDPPTHQPQRYITAHDLRHDPKPAAATARAPVMETQPKNKSGGSFFRRRRRGEPQGRQGVVPTTEEVAPGRPTRPIQSGRGRDGYF